VIRGRDPANNLNQPLGKSSFEGIKDVYNHTFDVFGAKESWSYTRMGSS
jgi:hypothetical protein